MSRIVSLDPYLEEEEVLRVGRRLNMQKIDETDRLPLIIPHDHHLANLVILDTHEMARHAGVPMVMCITIEESMLNSRSQQKKRETE